MGRTQYAGPPSAQPCRRSPSQPRGASASARAAGSPRSALAPRREVAESVLVLAAEIHAEDPALREVADHPSHTVGGVLDVHPAAPATATLGKDEHGLSPAEQVDEAPEHAGHFVAGPTAR